MIKLKNQRLLMLKDFVYDYINNKNIKKYISPSCKKIIKKIRKSVLK